MKIGLVGLGAMGRPMADNLIEAGHTLHFTTRRDAVRRALEDAGANWHATAKEVAQSVDLAITIVSADPEVRQVIAGPNGLLEGLASGALIIDMSTVSPGTAVAMGEAAGDKGVAFLDAPVSGGPGGAKRGTLTIMVGGEDVDVERSRPILDVLGERIVHVGPIGSGQTAKVINQLLSGTTMVLVGEALRVAERTGCDVDRIAECIATSSGQSAMFSARYRAVLDDDRTVGFRTALMRKDVGLAVELAQHHGVNVPLAEKALKAYRKAEAAGFADDDFSAVARYGGDAS